MKNEIKYIPYENLSAHYWLIIQNQMRIKPLSFKHKVKSSISGYWYRFKHSLLGISIIWYNGKNKGTYTMLDKPPTIKQRKNMVWTKHIMKRGKVTVTKC